jgi:hypothetical protein
MTRSRPFLPRQPTDSPKSSRGDRARTEGRRNEDRPTAGVSSALLLVAPRGKSQARRKIEGLDRGRI